MRTLIYDVGVNVGTDTAYYLHKGYDVIGIEAHPGLAKDLKERFASFIESGRLTLLNIGVAPQRGELEFWVCDDHSEWSSFDKAIASRNGSRHHSVQVPTLTFAEIVAAHGVPYFCKIDIEGNDLLCLSGFTPDEKPQFISIEMIHEEGEAELKKLRELGYSRFKIISQSTRSQPTRVLSEIYYKAPRRVRQWVSAADRALRGTMTDGDWHFDWGSSGPFGELTHGPWRSYENALASWRYLRDLWLQTRDTNIAGGDWYDIHATV